MQQAIRCSSFVLNNVSPLLQKHARPKFFVPHYENGGISMHQEHMGTPVLPLTALPSGTLNPSLIPLL